MKFPPKTLLSTSSVAYGLAALAFGVVTLIFPSYDDWLQLPWSTQAERIFATSAAIVQMLAGAAVVVPRTARVGAAALAVLYLLTACLSVPRVVAAPGSFSPYGDFFNEFVLVVGAAIVFLRSAAESAQRHRKTIVRTAFALCVVSFTLYQALYLDVTASLVPTWIPPNRMFWAVATTCFFGLAAVALVTNRMAGAATRLLALMIGLFGLFVWGPVVVAHLGVAFDWTEMMQTFEIAAVALVLADLLEEKTSPRARSSSKNLTGE